MGTSTRRINKKIKKILEEKNPTDFEQIIPDIYHEIMRVKKVNRFYSDEFSVAIGAGIAGITAITKGTFKEQYHFEGEMDQDPLTKEKIIEAILDYIGEDVFEEESPVKVALNYALTEAVRNDESNSKLFLFISEFCYFLIYLLISGQATEVITEYFSDLSAAEFDKKIKEIARNIVVNELAADILAYINGAKTLQELIGTITEKVAALNWITI